MDSCGSTDFMANDLNHSHWCVSLFRSLIMLNYLYWLSSNTLLAAIGGLEYIDMEDTENNIASIYRETKDIPFVLRNLWIMQHYPVPCGYTGWILGLCMKITAKYSKMQPFILFFLLLFPKKGRLPLYQVVESFRPAMARAYKLAQVNMAYRRFSFFFNPRYTVFL